MSAMTNEEAIDLLDNLIGMIEDNHNSDYDTAFKMAINALSQEPCEDAVSRTLVLDAVDKWIKCGEWYYSNATDYLFKRMKMLPSVNLTRERGTCLNCAMNFGLMHCEEFNPHDIVCEYWESDGLDKDDYCSQWKKADKGGEDAE